MLEFISDIFVHLTVCGTFGKGHYLCLKASLRSLTGGKPRNFTVDFNEMTQTNDSTMFVRAMRVLAVHV